MLEPGERYELNKTLKATYTQLPAVEVEDEQIRTSNLVRIDPKVAFNVPTSSDVIPTLLKTMPGVSSNNEFSSQYSVRGGNFDESLVYVNDIEIYRPFLIRAGQQEGLSFVNSDLFSISDLVLRISPRPTPAPRRAYFFIRFKSPFTADLCATKYMIFNLI